jgi:integrase/recombinase XerD
MKQSCDTALSLQHPPEGPLVPFLTVLATALRAQAYAEATVGRYVRLSADFSRWLKEKHVALANIGPSHVSRYLRYRYQRRRPTRDDPTILRRVVELLVDNDVIRRETEAPSITTTQRILNEYAAYLQKERGLNIQTIHHYLPFVRSLLTSCRGPLSELRIHDVVRFVQRRAIVPQGTQAHTMTAALRSFFRFTTYCGYTRNHLAAAVPRVAQWSLSTIPKAISQDHLKRVLASCNRESTTGRRDFAILLLLARLGLRAGEIVALELDDIDWRAGSLNVRGKGGYRSLLPLPPDAGKAIADYLKRRPRSNGSRALFTRAIAPIRGFANSIAICAIVSRALKRAGINSGRKGAHQFRHALACEMLRRGGSLSEIGQILRHQSLRTTAIYAKVDLTSLRSLALPWPGETP